MSKKVISKGFFRYVVEDDIARICSYRGFKFFLTIPKTLGGYTVTNMWGGAFFGCKRLVEVIIPDSITNISDMAFWGCKNLRSIEIPNSVTSIGSSAFVKCSCLTKISLREDHPVYTFYDGALFDKTKKLLCTYIDVKDSTSYPIPDFVTSIGNSAFSNCDSLTTMAIPDSVTSIGESAFSGCKSLTSVTLGNSIGSIENWAFSSCKSLAEITVPKSVVSIGKGAFGRGMTIVVEKGSYAHEYAIAEGFGFRKG